MLNSFSLANRFTSRKINRQIALNLIREFQPISRAELARQMGITRAVAGLLADQLPISGWD